MDRKTFTSALEKYLSKNKSASCLTSDGDAFIDRLFAEMNKEKPSVVDIWLKSKLNDKFIYAVEPPKWKGEKDWPYFQGEPMVFLHQFTLDMAAARKMKGGFPVGDTIYVFGAKRALAGDAWETVYKLIGQDNGGGSTEHLNYVQDGTS
ncbi:hypothetical protein [Cohnella soli]|uniref:Uncharacterized protein n=1 Tax=Cohnella soli TaxID=425005 RepID=A0ABW0I1B2_9BACL